jgi:peptidoglycan hydrolase-like protein with peptidoglycan-binding domain
MKRALLFVVLALCGVRLLPADQTIRSLQQTLKDQGFYYGTITGDKSAETTAAIRRYQIRNGLQVTGELNEETSRSVNSSSNSVASASQPASKPAAIQPNSVRPDASARLSQSSPPPSFNQPNRPLETNPPYSASFYQSVPLRVNRRMIAGAQYQLMSRADIIAGALMASMDLGQLLPCARFNRALDFRRLDVWTSRRSRRLGHPMRTSRIWRQRLAPMKTGCR